MKTYVLIIALAISTLSQAQDIKLQSSSRFILGSGNEKSASIGVGDIAAANSKQPNTLFFNFKNEKTWKKIQVNDQELNTYNIILVDLNNDQRLDLIESNSDAMNNYYINRLKINNKDSNEVF